MSSIRTPRPIYHHRDDVPIILPAKVAVNPSRVNVIACPTANVRDNLKALEVDRPVPPTYPTTRGTLDREHGVNEVKTPAIKARNGAIQKFSLIIVEIEFSIVSIYETPMSLKIARICSSVNPPT